jgi:hypothetical protein
MKPARWNHVSLLLLGVAGLGACRGQTSSEPPIVPIRNMYNQPRYKPQAQAQFFGDKRTMRPYIPGTIAREMTIDPELATGVTLDQRGYVLEVPVEISEKLGGIKTMLERGSQRYGIYCAPCHGLSGNGQGIIVKRGMLPPPSFHDPRLRAMPDGQIFAIVSNGIGNMPPYRHSIPVHDRWAIVSYLRTLQITQGSEQIQAQAAASTTQEATP